MSNSFQSLLDNKQRIIIFDGAMASYLYQKGLYINVCYEQINITNPDMVKDVHIEYVEAGAEVLTTNTFRANRLILDQSGIGDQLKPIITKGVSLAREVADQANNMFVAGDIGPIGKRLSPLGPISNTKAKKLYNEQIEIMVGEGVDLIVFETFTDISELELAIKCAKEITDLPIVAHLSVTEDGSTILGAKSNQLAQLARDQRLGAVGFNCSVGPHYMLKVIEEFKKNTDLVISAQPNAGTPYEIDNRCFYLSTPEYFATYAKRFLLNGVRLIGGCCGIGPDHIKTLKDSVKSMVMDSKAQESIPDIKIISKTEKKGLSPVPIEKRSRLARRLSEGYFVSSVELTPPKGCDPTKVIESAKFLKANGIDSVNIPDGPRASARMSPQMLAVILQQKVGIETIMHYCCRDRNVIGMQSDLLGAAAVGLNNILGITGDPPKLGHYPNATAVFDVDAIGLTKIIAGLNRGLDLTGNEINNTTSFFTGVGVNPVATNYDLELERFYKKIESGAEFAITQPVFDLEKLESFFDDIKDIKIPILIGIWPLASYRNAEFLNSEIPEITIPKYILDRMEKITDKEEAKIEGVSIARETLEHVKDRVQGVQVSAPFGRADLALKVVEGFISPDPEYQKV